MRPAIALVPGFFGFEHRGESTYFADRFVAGLRSVLEANGIRGVPVISVSTMGIAGLWKRQGDLLRQLRALETPTDVSPQLGGPRTWHLLGHSTGGVDAALVLRDAPLTLGRDGTMYGAPGWGPDSDLVDRIRSVTTIAAPHFGTGLAESPLAKFAAGTPSMRALRDMASITADVALRGDLASRIKFAMSATPGLTKMPAFIVQMMLLNDLARDLRPSVVGQLSGRPIRASAKGRLFSVATISPRPAEDHSDRLFRDMWRWTRDGAEHAPHRSWCTSHTFLDRDLRLPTQRDVELPTVNNGDNDGVVTTHRQVLGELIGLVIADHVDVLGRYRRVSLVDGKVIDPGLLTSGALFDDDEFFALLLRVGEKISAVIRADA